MAVACRAPTSALDERPTLAELLRCADVSTRWYRLGLQLTLEPGSLDAIEDEKRSVEDKLSAMFNLWLKRNPKVSRNDILKALRDIKENAIAENYEKLCKEAAEEKPLSLSDNIENSLERCRIQLKTPSKNDQDWAKKFRSLKEVFDHHVLPEVMKSLQVGDAKQRFQRILQSNFGFNDELLKECRNRLEDVKEAFDLIRFLIDLNFSSYLNYEPLKDLASNDCAVVDEYKMMHDDLLSQVSLPCIASIFRCNPGLVPGAIIGFPSLQFHLEQPQSYMSLQHWMKSLHPNLPSHIASIQAQSDGSIIITYSMYPPHYLYHVLSILQVESEYAKILSSKGVSTSLKLCKAEGKLTPHSTDDGDDSDMHQKTQSIPEKQQVPPNPAAASAKPQVLESLGMKDFECQEGPVVQYKGLLFTTEELKARLTNPEMMINVQPVLLLFSGLPRSGKTTAVKRFLDHYVEESSLMDPPITRKDSQPAEHVGIAHYDLIAACSVHGNKYKVTEAAKESSFTFGMLSILKHVVEKEERVPFLDSKAMPLNHFENFHLNDHFRYLYSFLCSQESIPKGSTDDEFTNEGRVHASNLLSSLPEGLGLVNIWDMASSNTAHHLLSALEGYLYNSFMWLFVDLDDDLEKLDENFEIERDGTVFSKQRPRLHYLLRSCWSTKSNRKERREVCTMFAKHRERGPAPVTTRGDKIKALKDKVQPLAKHIGVSMLLEDWIESINLDHNHVRLHDKFQRILSDETPCVKVPIAWLFLRSLFYRFKKTFVRKDDLKEMASECGMDEGSIKGFCEFFTSFGSIVDLSLVDSDYQYVIVKPVTFLKSLEEFFFWRLKLCQEYPTMHYGIVPEKACREYFKDDWPIFMDALVCLNLATRVATRSLEMPPDAPLVRRSNYYYIPLCCTGPLFEDPDPLSVHILTNIDTPHFFKQVSFSEQLLDTLPQPVLVPCKHMNQTVIKDLSTNTTITISSHIPAIKLQVDNANKEICTIIVQATQKIAEKSLIPVKYKFVRFCAKSHIENVESLPSAEYHVLPDGGDHCKKCRDNKKVDNALMRAWKEALHKNEIPDRFKPTGDLKDELPEIATKLQDISPDVRPIAEVLEVPDYNNSDSIVQILMKWHGNKVSQGNGGLEPRRDLARKLTKLGGKLAEKAKDEKTKKNLKQKCEKLAKEVDVFYKV